MELEQVKNLKIEESYCAKDNAEAIKTYEASRSINDETGEGGAQLRINFLTRALFAAESKGSLFAELLLERARCWYRVGALSRCVKDCDHVIGLETGSARSDEDETSGGAERRAECFALKVRCTESLKLARKGSHKKSARKTVASSKLPQVDGRSSSKLRSCSDAVTLSYDKTRGRHLVATRNIKAGSVLIVDEPFAFSTDGHALATNCLHCHVSLDLEENVRIPCNNCQSVCYCSTACREDSWKKYHKYECTIFDYFYETSVRDIDLAEEHRSHLLLAWRTTLAGAIDGATNRLSEEFLRHRESEIRDKSGDRRLCGTADPHDPLDYRTVLALETHCSESPSIVTLTRALHAVFLAKCLNSVLPEVRASRSVGFTENELILVAVAMLRHMQAVDCNAYEIVENSRDEGTKIWEPRNVGGAIYTTVSLVNHGCYPNVVRHSYPRGNFVIRALAR